MARHQSIPSKKIYSHLGTCPRAWSNDLNAKGRSFRPSFRTRFSSSFAFFSFSLQSTNQLQFWIGNPTLKCVWQPLIRETTFLNHREGQSGPWSRKSHTSNRTQISSGQNTSGPPKLPWIPPPDLCSLFAWKVKRESKVLAKKNCKVAGP